MDHVQIIKTPQGEKLAVMPLADYEKLRRPLSEDAQDSRAATKIMAGVKAGNIPLIPGDVVHAIIVDGLHPVRAFRQHLAMRAGELARLTKVDRSTITLIETRKRAGTVAAYKAIAKVFKVTVDVLLED